LANEDLEAARVAVSTPLPSGDRLGAVLREAGQADLTMAPDSNTAISLCESLVVRTVDFELASGLKNRRPRPKDRVAIYTTIGALSADLLRATKNTDSLGCCYRSVGREFHNTLTTRTIFNRLLPAWERMGLIETSEGFRAVDESGGIPSELRFATRIRATSRFLEQFAQVGILPSKVDVDFRHLKNNASFVTLSRAAKKQRARHDKFGRVMKPEPSAKYEAIAAAMVEINNRLEAHKFNLQRPPQLRRCFNNGDQPDFDWNMGGRFFSFGKDGYQELSKDCRRKIKIDGEDTVELDVKASHASIAHAVVRSNEPMPDDPYSISDVEREVAKLAVVIAFGLGAQPKQWPTGERGRLAVQLGVPEKSIPAISEVWEKLVASNPFLEVAIEKGVDWSILQYHEAEALGIAMTELWRKGIPSLPVHDSLIVPVSKKDVARDLLAFGFEKQVGALPTIVESTG